MLEATVVNVFPRINCCAVKVHACKQDDMKFKIKLPDPVPNVGAVIELECEANLGWYPRNEPAHWCFVTFPCWDGTEGCVHINNRVDADAWLTKPAE